MSVIIANPTTATGFSRGASFIGIDNVFLQDQVALTPSAEDLVNGPASNALSWLTHARWRFSAAGSVFLSATFQGAPPINSIGIHRHNLGSSGCTVRLQYSADGTTFTNLIEFIPGAEDRTLFRVADTSQVQPHWRVEIVNPNGADIAIGNIFVGNAVQLFGGPEFGWSPPPLAREDRFLNSQSEGGDFIGRSLHARGSVIDVTVSTVPDDWVRTIWKPIYDAMFSTPFYYSWDNTNHPDDAAFCFTNRTPPKPVYQSPTHLQIGFNAIALVN